MDINFCIVASLLAIILSSITAAFSFLAYSKVVGLQNSTHQVQWMPMEEPPVKAGDKKEEVKKDNSDLMNQFRKMYPDIEQEQV